MQAIMTRIKTWMSLFQVTTSRAGTLAVIFTTGTWFSGGLLLLEGISVERYSICRSLDRRPVRPSLIRSARTSFWQGDCSSTEQARSFCSTSPCAEDSGKRVRPDWRNGRSWYRPSCFRTHTNSADNSLSVRQPAERSASDSLQHRPSRDRRVESSEESTHLFAGDRLFAALSSRPWSGVCDEP